MLELQYGNHAFSEIQYQLIRDTLNKIFSVEKGNIDINFLKEQCDDGNINAEILSQIETNQTKSNVIMECCKFKKILREIFN